MNDKKTEPHNTQDGYCCACEYDLIELKRREDRAFRRGQMELVPLLKRVHEMEPKELFKLINSLSLPDEGLDNKSV